VGLSVTLLPFWVPLGHWGLGFGLNALPGEAPGEGARETPSGKPLGQSLHLGAGIPTSQAQLGESGSCGTLLGPLRVLFDDAQGCPPDRLRAVRLPRCALRQQSLREFIVDAATPQLLQERTVATLPGSVA
jgi:hypothetical protein